MYTTLKKIRRTFYTFSLLILSYTLQAQDQKGDPKLTEVWDPVPAVINPGKSAGFAPSDAIILFDGRNLNNWSDKNGNRALWNLNADSSFIVKPGTGDIQSRELFGSCQLHIEFKTPATVEGEGQGRGNSGIFLMGLYEVQVLDSYNNRTYSNGQSGSIYKQHIPLVNACRPPGEWQTYDIIFTAPKFENNGKLSQPARVTVIQNGVLVQNNVEIKGETVYIGQPKYKKHRDKEPIKLQDHGDLVSYRNIWVRPL